VTRTHMSSPGSDVAADDASPSADHARAGSRATGLASLVGLGSLNRATPGRVIDDNGITLPAARHVFVADALLQQHDALEQGLGPRRAARARRRRPG
jgi:hypothetical protein